MHARNKVDLYREDNTWFARLKEGPEQEFQVQGNAPAEALRNLAQEIEMQDSGQRVAQHASSDGKGNRHDRELLRDSLHWQPEDFGQPRQ